MPTQDNSTPPNPETQITPFNFGTNEVRVIRDENGEPWFIAADVCKVLELSNVGQALSRLDDDEKRDIISNDVIGKLTPMSAVNETGLYTLVLGSRKAEAKTFKRWITHEVLPAIRKTGHYSVEQLDPVLALMEGVKQTRLAQLELERQLHEHDGQIHDHDGRLLALESGRGYVTLKGYYNLHRKVAPDKSTLSQLGKRAVQLSAEMGYGISSVPDTTYGTVRAYHQDVLERLLGF